MHLSRPSRYSFTIGPVGCLVADMVREGMVMACTRYARTFGFYMRGSMRAIIADVITLFVIAGAVPIQWSPLGSNAIKTANG
jgi:hypothetical protein